VSPNKPFFPYKSTVSGISYSGDKLTSIIFLIVGVGVGKIISGRGNRLGKQLIE
jgi:hypothetical protein